MCGFIGVASLKSYDTDMIIKGSEKLSHRGPDSYSNQFSDDSFAFMSHRRLSIIDLSNAGIQPMVDINRKYYIVFNGEIYNYKTLRSELIKRGKFFKTESDTEVLLNSYIEWGLDSFSKLEGMFSFVIYDSILKKIIMVRDRAGEKPLLYVIRENKIIFSSELLPLMEDYSIKKELNTLGLEFYLSSGYVPPDISIISGVSKLEPGNYAIFNLINSSLEVKRYWNLPKYCRNDNFTFQKITNDLDELIVNSVKSQLNADVPIGILLSGGLDSSLIAEIAAREVSNLNTFTVSLLGHGNYDESNYARLISANIKSNHHEIYIDNKLSADSLEEIVRKIDEPLADSSIIPMYIISKYISKSCKVAIGGEGADELFGGYKYYNKMLEISKRNFFMKINFIKQFAMSCHKIIPIGIKGRNLLYWYTINYNKELPINPQFFDYLHIDKKNPINFSFAKNQAKNYYLNKIDDVQDLIQMATRMDFNMYLSGDILAKVDKMSMLNSLEVRSPFLNKNIIEYAFKNIPSHFKCNPFENKIILKNIAQKYFPKNYEYNRKQGFSIPLAKWIKEKGKIRDLFLTTLYSQNTIFNRKYINNLVKGFDSGYSNSERIFSLVMLELWKKNINLK